MIENECFTLIPCIVGRLALVMALQLAMYRSMAWATKRHEVFSVIGKIFLFLPRYTCLYWPNMMNQSCGFNSPRFFASLA